MSGAVGITGLDAALAGQYVLERELGRGGMGIVYLAREVNLDRQVALKVLPPELAAHPELRARFVREARTAAQLSHPNIIPVFRADELGGFAFFAMGYVDGETVAERVRARGRLSPAETVRILREAAWALAYAHARGVIHRDVKPENLMVERAGGRVLVADFGIARDSGADSLTQFGVVMGSVHVMSPEQAAGEPIDGRADLYALGVVGFYALTGRLPFDGSESASVLAQHLAKPAPDVRTLAPDVPAALATAIARCLAKRPADRYPTGEALADALGRALEEGDGTSAETPVPRVLSTEQAEQVWLRAAQLQMDAASRVRQRTTAVAPVEGAPTSGYRLAEVQAAAQEVGIAPEFVQLALAELPAAAAAPASAAADQHDATITRLLGTSQRSIRVARTIEAPAARALEALGRVVQAHPWQLTLLDTVGGHPLDGGVMAFRIPKMQVSEGSLNMFAYRATQLELAQLSLTVHALPGAADRTEIVAYGDLRPGAWKNAKWSRAIAGVTGAACGSVGAAFGIKAAAGGALAALGIAGGGALLGLAAAAGSVLLYRASYRGALQAMEEQLQEMLQAVSAEVRSRDVFGAPPPAPRLPPRRPTGDGGLTAMLGGVGD